jgi:hypothetical protein
MGKKVSLFLLLSLLVFSLRGSVAAQHADSLYVSATGHWIWGEFLQTYNSNPDPLFYFGNPITDDFIDPLTKNHVQYFEKARFDLIETSEGPQVRLAELGQLLHESGTPLADIPNEGTSCRAFSSGYSICYAFLQFYDSFDGATHFGLPISDVEVIDGRYVQYFDYARMEWWPDLPAGQRVQLTDLGQVYFDKFVADPDLLKPSPPPESSGSRLNPRVSVFTAKSLIGAGEQQTVYVIAQDMFLRPVEAAQVEVTMLYPNGTSERYRLPPTNEYGVSQFTYTTTDLPVQSTVYIKAEIQIRGETAGAKAWFRIWW